MVSKAHALSREELIRTLTAYSGITTADGAADGSTLEDSNLIGRNDFVSEKTILILSGNAKDEDKGAASFAPLTGVITLQGTGFSDQILAGTIFRVLNISTTEVDVAAIAANLGVMAAVATSDDMSDILTTPALAKLRLILNRLSPDAFAATIQGASCTALDTMLAQLATYFAAAGAAMAIKIQDGTERTNLEQILEDFFAIVGCDDTNLFNPTIGGTPRTTFDAAFEAIGTALAALIGAAGLFHEQADVLLTFNTVNGSETNVFNLVVADTRYIVRSLRLKFADPGANTITVRLYELVNDGLIEVDSFEVTTANFGTYHSLMDMFGMAQLAGDNLKVTTRVSAGGDLATLGQYSHAKTNV